jgi:hypothetical protein
MDKNERFREVGKVVGRSKVDCYAAFKVLDAAAGRADPDPAASPAFLPTGTLTGTALKFGSGTPTRFVLDTRPSKRCNLTDVAARCEPRLMYIFSTSSAQFCRMRSVTATLPPVEFK